MLVLVAACSGGGSSSPSTPATSSTPPTPSASVTSTVTTVPAPTTTAAPVLPARLWVATVDGEVLGLDPSTLAVLDTVPVTSAAPGERVDVRLAATAGTIWAAVTDGTEVVRIDEDTGAVDRVDLGEHLCCVAADGDQVWMAGWEDGIVLRLDPVTGDAEARGEIGAPYPHFVLGAGMAYAVTLDNSEVVRLDPGTGDVVARRTVEGVSPGGVVVDDTLWVGGSDGLEGLALDTLRRNRLVELQTDHLGAGDGAVWVQGFQQGLWRVDPVSGASTKWDDLETAVAVVAGGGRLFVTDQDGVLHAGSTTEPGLTAVDGLDAAVYWMVLVPAHRPDGTPVEPPVTTTSPTPTTEPGTEPVDVPAGVRWESVALPSSAATSSAHDVAVTSRGVVVLGGEDGRPAIWFSPDGTSFTRADTGAVSAGNVSMVAAGPSGFVAAGSHGSQCWPDTEVCSRRQAVLWYSADGLTWQAASVPDGSLEAALLTSVSAVVAFRDGFVAVGQAVFSASDWRVPVWRSDDGRTWRQVALLRESPGLFDDPALAVAGSRLVLSADLIVCDLPSATPDGFGWGPPPPRLGRGFTSTDAETWQPLDVVALGLAEDTGPLPCAGTGLDTVHGMVSVGTVVPVGGEALWIRGTTADGSGTYRASTDGLTWRALPEPPAVTSAPYLPVPRPTGGAIDAIVRVVPGEVERGRTRLATLTFDGTAWTDWTGWGSGVPVLEYELRGGPAWDIGIESVAALGDLAVLVGTVADLDIAPHAVAYVSRPATVAPTPEPTCTPGPAANCAGVVWFGLDLGGEDLHGIDLTGALLRKVDLRGADLSGAVLLDARLDSVQLEGADLSGAVLRRLDLGALTTFDGVDLTGADLRGERLGSNAVGAVFANARLAGGAAAVTDFTGADFSGADLTEFSFIGANLTGARFAGAVLTGTSWSGSTCPDGTVLSSDLDATCAGHFLD